VHPHRSASIASSGRDLELFLVHSPVGGSEQAVANCSSARRSSGPSGTGGSAADHRLTASTVSELVEPSLVPKHQWRSVTGQAAVGTSNIQWAR
jgi:hypothetical protein